MMGFFYAWIKRSKAGGIMATLAITKLVCSSSFVSFFKGGNTLTRIFFFFRETYTYLSRLSVGGRKILFLWDRSERKYVFLLSIMNCTFFRRKNKFIHLGAVHVGSSRKCGVSRCQNAFFKAQISCVRS